MNYNVIDIISPNINKEKLKNIINKKLYEIIIFLENGTLNEA